MIKFLNIGLAFVLVALIIGVYHIRYSAEAEARAVKRLERQIAAEQDRHRTLQAEWASLNDPRRLQLLARQYLSLDTLRASQVIDLRDETPHSIPVALPVVKNFDGGVNEPQ